MTLIELAYAKHKRYYVFMDSNTPQNVPVTPVPATPTPEPVAPVAPTPPPPPPAPAPVEPVGSVLANEPEPAPMPAPEVPVAPTPPPPPAPVMPEPTAVVEPMVAPAAPAPVAPASVDRMEDGPEPIVNRHGQEVTGASKKGLGKGKLIAIIVVAVLIVAGLGYAAYAYFMKPNVQSSNLPASAQVPSISQVSAQNLTQATDKVTLVAGAATNSTALVFTATSPSSSASGVQLQIEIQPLGTAFTGTPMAATVAVPDASNPLKLTVSNYAEGSYHWQDRLTDGTNNGPWVAYAQDSTSKTADFTVDRKAPTAAVLKTLNAKTVVSKTLSSAVAAPVFAGTAEAGTTVTVALSATITAKAVTDASGVWSVTEPTTTNGRYTVTITTTDAAGNATPATYTLTQSAR